MKKYIRYTAILAALALLLAGCGNSTEPTTGPPLLDPYTPAPVPVTTAAPMPASVALTHVAKFKLKTNQGHTGTVEIRQGDLVQADKAQPNNGTLPGVVCQIKDTTHAVAVPISITLTNTTTGFSLLPAVTLVTVRPPTEADNTRSPHLYVELSSETGTRCADVLQASSASNPTASSSGELSTGQSAVVGGWLVATNYVTPEYPRGNPKGLLNAVVQVEGATTNRLAMTVTGGVGSIGLAPFVGEPRLPTSWGVPWNPANKGGCYATIDGC